MAAPKESKGTDVSVEEPFLEHILVSVWLPTFQSRSPFWNTFRYPLPFSLKCSAPRAQQLLCSAPRAPQPFVFGASRPTASLQITSTVAELVGKISALEQTIDVMGRDSDMAQALLSKKAELETQLSDLKKVKTGPAVTDVRITDGTLGAPAIKAPRYNEPSRFRGSWQPPVAETKYNPAQAWNLVGKPTEQKTAAKSFTISQAAVDALAAGFIAAAKGSDVSVEDPAAAATDELTPAAKGSDVSVEDPAAAAAAGSDSENPWQDLSSGVAKLKLSDRGSGSFEKVHEWQHWETSSQWGVESAAGSQWAPFAGSQWGGASSGSHREVLKAANQPEVASTDQTWKPSWSQWSWSGADSGDNTWEQSLTAQKWGSN